MKYHRKLHLIKLYSRRIKMIKIQALMQQQDKLYASYFTSNGAHSPPSLPASSLPDQDSEEPEIDEDNFDIADYINSLPLKLKKQFRNSNPQLPDIFFMTKAEKKKFFEDINNKFKKNLSQAPQRKSKNKKKLKFSNQFQVRGFNEGQKVVNVRSAKDIKQTYSNQIHFS